jgi:hypothetical protein
MGLGLKVVLFLFAILVFPFGGWMITALVFGYIFLPPLLLRRRKGSPAGANPRVAKGRGHLIPAGRVLGVVLLALSVVAVASHGTLSPIVFGVPGLLLVFRPRFLSRLSLRVKPVKDSILLRGRFLPFAWFALAEVKVSTRDVEGAISGTNERVLLLSAPSPRIFLVFASSSVSRSRAEEAMLKRMQVTARALRSLGVYLLPLDGLRAFEVSQLRATKVDLPEQNILHSLSSDYGALAVEAVHGFVARFELYERSHRKGPPGSLLARPNRRPGSSTTLRELLRAATQRTGTPKPDGYVEFLSSMAATEGETLGQRITETVQASDKQLVLVASVGSPQVELSRAQLKAVTTIYE